MRIAFVWTGVTSYMSDCWRKLAAEPDVELKVWIDVTSAAAKAVAFDVDSLMTGVAHEIVDGGFDVESVVAWKPEILFVVGWRSAVCRAVVIDRRLKSVPKVCCFDMPWRWALRCFIAPLVLGRFLRNYRAAFVPGVRCARYAKWLGFKDVHTGLFAIDVQRFSSAEKSGSRKYFLYVGRNSSEKRLDDIREAHRIYGELGGRLELRMYGKGLENGFADPNEVPSLMRNAAGFVLASDFDPWPLVLLEAMSAGCPVIASDRCTNRPELGKNWHVFRCGDVKALARELLMVEEQETRDDDLAEESARKVDFELALQYDCAKWVERVRTISKELVK